MSLEANDDDIPLRSAEEWLAQRGVERQPLIVRADPTPDPVPADPVPVEAVEAVVDLTTAEPSVATVTEVRVTETLRIAEAAQAERDLVADLEAAQPRQQDSLSDDVARAIAYVRNATASTPMTEGRLRERLAAREHPDVVIRLALDQARRERLVDDVAYAASLVDEWRERGHGDRRIRDDLRKRGFDHDLVVESMARIESPDPEAAAFAVARDRADSLSGLEPEKAYRRLVAYLARRGHAEGLARKVARQVLWVEREQQQTAGH